MANDNDKKKSQNVPKLKAKDKDDDKQLTRRAGPQSGQHNSPARDARFGSVMEIRPRSSLAFTTSQNVIGQQPIGLTDGRTGQLALNGVCVTTGFEGNTKYSFSAATANGAHEAFDAIVSELEPALKPGDFLTCEISLTNVQDWLDKNAKRKRPTTDYDDEEDTAARRSARRTREAALWQQAVQRESGQGSGQDQGQTDEDSQRRHLCVGCKSEKHTLAECLKAGADGYMKGCPLCNTMEHNAGNCPHPALKNNKLLSIRYFINNRRNMPSFLNIEAWYPLVNKNIHHSDLRQDFQFPWTPEFTKSIAGCIDDLQRKVEEKGLGEAKLPVDPSVNGWPNVVAYHQSLERDEKERAMVEKAAAAFMASSLVPDTEPTVPDEEDIDMAGNAQVASPPLPTEQSAAAPGPVPPEEEYLAHAMEHHDASQRRPWDDSSSDGDSDDDDDDDDDDDEDMTLRNLKKSHAKLQAAKMAIRAQRRTSER
ncbi:hypothetical protein FMUND_10795 [Fusarium mundagurra]|uniref:Uncharacterized protein n=1 Tax=Fusarium mundagurra TaxID=1567541 RepID=A0A8H5Y9A3_9HYPO|nr:hypothetical protein FMUND_10795 [Fusarium mundagurra]